MIDEILNILGTVNYVGAVIIAGLLAANSLTHKAHFWLKLIPCSLAIATASFLFEQFVHQISIPIYWGLLIRTSNCVLVFFLTMGLIRLCYESTWQQALFCVTAGYCLEHFSARFASFLFLLLPWQMNSLLVILVRLPIYMLVYFFLFKKVSLSDLKGNHKTQIIIAAIIIFFAIFVSAYSEMSSWSAGKLIKVFNYLYSLALCVIGLFVEFYQVLYDRVQNERDILQQIICIEAEKYQKEKAAIDVINVKYHDLKHELHRLEAEYGKDKLRDMRQAIDGYSSFFRTGNVALDTVLAIKNYACIQKNIQLTCMANGEELKKLSEADVYSLFGNMLDNAIEAVENLPESQRIISLNVINRNRFLFIHCENYCAETPTFIDGMPQTTKQDKNFHGFGTHSQQVIAEKYEGVCSFGVRGNIFFSDIVLPI